MADTSTDKPSKAPKVTKKSQTVRERTRLDEKRKPKRLRTTASKVVSPLKRVHKTGKKEYSIPMPDNKVGRVMNKRVRITPKFLKDAWAEVRLVTWPNRKETIRLTFAVFIFAFIFAVIVGLLDYGLDKIFKELIVKK